LRSGACDAVFAYQADETMDFRIFLSEIEIKGLDQKTDFNFVLKDKKTGEIKKTRAIFISGGAK